MFFHPPSRLFFTRPLSDPPAATVSPDESVLVSGVWSGPPPGHSWGGGVPTTVTHALRRADPRTTTDKNHITTGPGVCRPPSRIVVCFVHWLFVLSPFGEPPLKNPLRPHVRRTQSKLSPVARGRLRPAPLRACPPATSLLRRSFRLGRYNPQSHASTLRGVLGFLSV